MPVVQEGPVGESRRRSNAQEPAGVGLHQLEVSVKESPSLWKWIAIWPLFLLAACRTLTWPMETPLQTEAPTTAPTPVTFTSMPLSTSTPSLAATFTAVPAPTPTGNAVDPPETELSATLEMPRRLPNGETVKLKFTLTNNSEADLYVLKWYTPLEGIAGEIFRVERDGQLIPYEGILAMRGDPTPEAYLLLEAGRSVSAEVDLATAYDFSPAGEYTITFLSPRISDVARTKEEMARTVGDLGRVEIPSNSVTVKIEGSSN